MDSGADSTLLPKGMASNLGLDPDQDLEETKDGSAGAGATKFTTWTTPHRITGQVLANLASGTGLWGPSMPLSVKFAEGSTPLLGRADFFTHFSITFEEEPPHGPVFHLDYDSTAATP